MSTIRVVRRERYTVIDRDTIRDPKLSLRALGLMVWLLDHPNNWRISSREIATQVREGRDAIRRCLAEMEAAGYLVVTKNRGERGRFCTDLVLYERPVDNEFTGDGFSVPGATRDDGIETPGGTGDGFSVPGATRDDDKTPDGTGAWFTGAGKPGPIRKTVNENCPAESSRDDLRAADEIVLITDEDLDAISSARIRKIIAAKTKRGTDEPIVD